VVVEDAEGSDQRAGAVLYLPAAKARGQATGPIHQMESGVVVGTGDRAAAAVKEWHGPLRGVIAPYRKRTLAAEHRSATAPAPMGGRTGTRCLDSRWWVPELSGSFPPAPSAADHPISRL